jgi:ferrous iron transport protein B
MQPVTRKLRVALAGNPNSGKTSVFNLLTGLHQQVGNWAGVTVERKSGRLRHGAYELEITDLPGTYSLTSYTLEERIARQFILEEHPDVIVNVVDAANLERNLQLTAQLLEMGVDLVVDLNMWDEFTGSGARLDLERFGALIGAPVVTTVGHRGHGRTEILDAILRLVEGRSRRHRHVPVSLGTRVETVVQQLADRAEQLAVTGDVPLEPPARYLATKLLEGDPQAVEHVHNRLPALKPLLLEADEARRHVRQATGLEPARVIAAGRHGFIEGLLRETLSAGPLDRMRRSRQLDRVLTHRMLGLPIFVGFMWLLFNATFVVGSHPAAWIERIVALLASLAAGVLPAGVVRDLVVDGVLGGVGAVAVFLPSIMILFLGIALLEDTGYMARIAFIMDRVMHLFGLHGKSFIPMLTGFGCTVPAILATRTLESRRDRTLTALLVPHMSCSARLPVYVLLAGAFFGANAGNVVMAIYLLGILIALGVGVLFSRTLLREEQAAFVMELPPYRWPTLRGLGVHTWARSRHYLKKMAGVILLASIVLWALGNFPRSPAAAALEARAARLAAGAGAAAEVSALRRQAAAAAIEASVIGRLGLAIEPVLRPLGFDWRMGVSLVSGFVAKEVVVSTMGVLYHVGASGVAPGAARGAGAGAATGGRAGQASLPGLREALREPDHGFTPLVAAGFMVFVLLYTPCVASILAMRRELGARWMWFDVGYQIALAWLAAFAVYQLGRALGWG